MIFSFSLYVVFLLAILVTCFETELEKLSR